jgi:hypothetical protein
MNLFKGLLFLHGQSVESQPLDSGRVPTYGNRIAAERRFRDAFSQPWYARLDPAANLCSDGGCG